MADTATAPATPYSPKLSMKRYLYCGNKYWELANGCYPVSDGPSGSLQGWSPEWSPDWPWTSDADANVANMVANVDNRLTMGEIMQPQTPETQTLTCPRVPMRKSFSKSRYMFQTFRPYLSPIL